MCAEDSNLSTVILRTFDGDQDTAGFQLRLVGELEGTPGKITIDDKLNTAAFAVASIELASKDGSAIFVAAALPNPVPIPAALLKDEADPTNLRSSKEIDDELNAIIARLGDEVVSLTGAVISWCRIPPG